MKKLLSIPLWLLALLLVPVPGHAQSLANSCRERVTSELQQIHDEYRSQLFGSVRDRDGRAVAKTGGEVRQQRTGIFERRGRLTSELIDPIIESYRVYRCQNMMVCRAMSASFDNPNPNAPQTFIIPGCEDVTMPVYSQCRFTDASSQQDIAEMTNFCAQTVEDTLAFERDALTLAVAYDAGYRAMLQFSGMVDWMMKDMPTRNFLPLRSMVNMLGSLYQIPCFTGQCDLPDNRDLDIPTIPSL